MSWQNIVLVGFMGTGKSTVGLTLEEALKWKLIDVDQAIVEREGLSIPDIFSTRGEAAFRAIESEVLETIMARSEQIVATGGGAVLAERNRESMSRNGLVVALKASAETIVARVSGDTNRPLLQGNPAEFVPILLEKRKGAYDFADVEIDTDLLTAQEIAGLIVQQMKTFQR
ncbi:shikimate kinase [Paenibacillus contaminans]|uniref:Shikimate kinase n=1 Tax=Paenibacillus contaminans TaxID=450362 RepID=A0A329MKQ5_9BACL|nr:shikimate kinase [Paenibacillus contaminans]RAV19886.1 shikimate kinase [Paenibacillus contaminans]